MYNLNGKENQRSPNVQMNENDMSKFTTNNNNSY